MKGFVVREGAVLCAGAKVFCKEGTLEIGKEAIVATNAVALHSIADYWI